MDTNINEKIRANPRFQALVKRRTFINTTMFVLSMIIYFGLIFTVAFAPDKLKVPMSADSVVAIGWPLGAAVVIVPWLMTLLYVRFANADSGIIQQIFKESGV